MHVPDFFGWDRCICAVTSMCYILYVIHISDIYTLPCKVLFWSVVLFPQQLSSIRKKQTSRLKRHRIPRFNSCAVAGWEGTTRGSTQAIFGDFLEVKTSPFWGLKSATISTSIRLSIGGSPSGGDSFWQVLLVVFMDSSANRTWNLWICWVNI